MDKLEKKTLDVSRGFTYTYYNSPAKDSKPTLLLIHGFPDAPETYEEVIRDYLVPNGYGVIAIDCLGYNGTSKVSPFEAHHVESTCVYDLPPLVVLTADPISLMTSAHRQGVLQHAAGCTRPKGDRRQRRT